jgi:predicted XRE-type DNA-binding protein
MEITRDNLLKLIHSGITAKTLSVSALERDAGVPKDTVRDFLRGKTQILRADKLQKILRILDPTDKVRITGTISTGADIIFNPPAAGEEVDCPPGVEPSDVIAVRIKGDSMLPVFHDGWIIYYSRRPDINIPPISGGFQVPYSKTGKSKSDRFASFIGKPCVIGLPGGRALLGTLKQGQNKTYDLINHNGHDLRNITPQWAAKIIFIKTE